jgi:hypothetical protein
MQLRRRGFLSSSNLIRWAGLAALVAGVLFIIVDLLSLFVFGFDQRFAEAIISSGLLFFRSTPTLLAGALILLGLVGLYARQSEATGISGLVSFLVAFVCTVLAQGSILADLLANLGWALFGVSCLQARIYPRVASILLIVGAVSTAVASSFPRSEPGGVLMYVVIGADIILNAAIAWLGFDLFGNKRRRHTPGSLVRR